MTENRSLQVQHQAAGLLNEGLMNLPSVQLQRPAASLSISAVIPADTCAYPGNGVSAPVSPYLDSSRVFGEGEEPLRCSVEDAPVNGHRPVRTPGDDTLHHANAAPPPGLKLPGLTAPPGPVYRR